MSKRLHISQAIDYLLGIVSSTLTITLCMLVAQLLHGCANAQNGQTIGITLLFINKGSYSMGVHRFAPDGQTGPVPGALGVGGSAQMSFMPADSKRGIPQFVDIEWFVSTPEYRSAFSEYKRRFPQKGGMISKEELMMQQIEREKIELLGITHKRRIALTSILTPELLAQVRTNRKNTLLKLKVVFTDDDVTVTGSPEVWR